MADEFKIEKNVPLPARRRANAPLFPLEKMNVGDSFAVPTNGEVKKVKTQLYSAIRYFKQHHPKTEWAIRVMKDGDQVAVRVWRMTDAPPPKEP